MKQRATHYLVLLALLFYWLAPTGAQAQTAKNTMAVGYFHALCIRPDGTLWGTGNNDKGELGDGTTQGRNVWTQLSTATNWTQVAAGGNHSLALRADGSLWVWGFNFEGQLGVAAGSNTAQPNPVPMQVPGTWAQVAAGHSHTLALKADGTLWAWGSNYFGQLGYAAGNSQTVPHPVPTQVPGTWAQIAAGGDFSLALTPTGSLYAWGDNRMGQLANVTNLSANVANPTPLQIGGTWAKASAGGEHGLALKVDGTLWAWGNNIYGQLANTTDLGVNAAHTTPVQVAGTYSSVAAGYYHSLALHPDGTLWGWGFCSFGQLGSLDQYGTASTTPVPRQVAGTWVQVVGSSEFSMGLRADGSLWTWGNNTYGQLGKGPAFVNIYGNPLPAATTTALPTRSTTGGSNFGLAIKGDGTLWAWGDNEYGQLGIGTGPGTRRPTQVGTDHDWVQVVAGSQHGLALKANGTTWAWGYNGEGQLGLGTTATQYTPALVNAPALVSLAAGDAHSLGLMATGQVYAWGQNTSGQLGTGTALSTSLLVPTAVPGGYQFASLAAGADHSLALKVTGLLYAWGSNQYGQRGDGFAAIAPTPVPAGNPGPLVQLAAGQYHSLGRTAAGQVYAWGQNTSGQTGNATLTTTPTPTLVPGLPLARQVVAGQAHSLALTAVGTIYTWGGNSKGQLALNTFTTTPSPTPAQEITNNTGWAQLAGSGKGDFSLARTASGLNFASAGLNSSGQLGDGTYTNWPRFDRLSPLTSLQPLPVLGAAGGAAFALAPNPARTQATAVGLPASSTLAVYDAVGRLVMTSASLSFSVAGLPAGLYLVRATAPGQAVQSARLLVE